MHSASSTLELRCVVPLLRGWREMKLSWLFGPWVQLAAEVDFFLMQSRYPCHAQTFQVSTNAQPEDIIAAFMVNVILIWLSWQVDFKSILLCVGAGTAVAAFLGEKNVAYWVL